MISGTTKKGGNSETTTPEIRGRSDYRKSQLIGADSRAETSRRASVRVGKPNCNWHAVETETEVWIVP